MLGGRWWIVVSRSVILCGSQQAVRVRYNCPGSAAPCGLSVSDRNLPDNSKNDLCHTGLLVAAITTAKFLKIRMAEAARSGVHANVILGRFVGFYHRFSKEPHSYVVYFGSFPPAAALYVYCQPKIEEVQ